jgi:hypothetical protein
MLNAFQTSGTSPTKKAGPDFSVFSDVPHPTIYMLTPLSKNACSWVSDITYAALPGPSTL